MNDGDFIEDLASSSEDEDVAIGRWCRLTSRKRDLLKQNCSTSAILDFSSTLGPGQHEIQSPEPSTCYSDVDGESDGSVEEWMILDQVSEAEDCNMQLNLSFSFTSTEEDEDTEDDETTLVQDAWTVSKRDKETGEVSNRHQSLLCSRCKRIGHLAKSCQIQRKCPICVLCGILGHHQKECPSRPCSRCGLLSHGAVACARPPVWYQHCQRCGVMGHLPDICPDTWRQYHHTIRNNEAPLKPWTCQSVERRTIHAHCYNCSKRGHYGHECRLRRMISGTFSTLPYVCHYDDSERIDRNVSRSQSKHLEIRNKTQPLAEWCLESIGEAKVQLMQRWDKQKAESSMRKTWPKRRRERREMKKLRREAQTRRESGILEQSWDKPESDILDSYPFGVSNHCQLKVPFKKMKKMCFGNQRRKKSKDTKQWKKGWERKHFFSDHQVIEKTQ